MIYGILIGMGIIFLFLVVAFLRTGLKCAEQEKKILCHTTPDNEADAALDEICKHFKEDGITPEFSDGSPAGREEQA